MNESFDIEKISILQDTLNLIPAEVARNMCVLPVAVNDDGAVSVCMLDIENYRLVSRLERIMNCDIIPVVPTNMETFPYAVEKNYPVGLVDGNFEMAVDLFKYILERALHSNVSDIHISPVKDGSVVKFRIDGKMQTDREIPAGKSDELISYIKVLGGMDISQKRIPLDGNINYLLNENEIDLRVATIPTIHGEHITLRILSQTSENISLESIEDLGLKKKNYDLLKHSLSISNGVIIISGPTGSGKTTTLYAALRELVEKDIYHIVSIEDPVEKPVKGVTQIKVDRERVSFHKALRSVLRHDPDVIMIGEIRDAETADIALKSALTGHLVLASLHTNSAPGILTRLVDLGVPPFLVASTLRLAIAQRLVRKPCKHCLELENIDAATCAKYKLEDNIKIPKINGCPYCNETGYLGRTAIYEMLPVNDTVKALLMKGQSETELNKYLKNASSELTLRGDALAKVIDGKTTIEEVDATTIDEDNILFNLEHKDG